MTVYFENETEREFPFDPEEQAKKVISFVCDHENCPYETEVSVTIVEKETIREINAEHRQVDRVTDVLSFPADEGDEILSIPDDFLGDIMISVPRAAEQGAALGHSTERELMFLTVHGVLHLLGFDHMRPEDETVMLEHQRRIMSAIAKQIDGCTE